MTDELDDVDGSDGDPEELDAVDDFFAKVIFRRLMALKEGDNWQFEVDVPWRYDAKLGIDGARDKSSCKLQPVFVSGDERDERPWLKFNITNSGFHTDDGTSLFDWLRATFPEQ